VEVVEEVEEMVGVEEVDLVEVVEVWMPGMDQVRVVGLGVMDLMVEGLGEMVEVVMKKVVKWEMKEVTLVEGWNQGMIMEKVRSCKDN
jgi:hypothetical protein